jgi:ribosomal-protein-alanine N-acetyltransferase
VRRSVEERGGRLLLIEDEHGLAGALLLRAEAGEAEVLLVAVHPQRRGLGHGRALLRSGEAAAIEAGAGRCFLEVRAGNVAALGLYESEGYERVGCRPGYYGDGEDAFVLARDLGSQPLPGS